MRIEWLNQEALQHGGVTLGAALASAPMADGVSRRGFMKAGAAAGGGLMLGFFLPGAGKLALAADGAPAGEPRHAIHGERGGAHQVADRPLRGERATGDRIGHAGDVLLAGAGPARAGRGQAPAG